MDKTNLKKININTLIYVKKSNKKKKITEREIPL